MNKKKINKEAIKEVLFWLMIAFIFILGIWLFIYIKTESFECMSNPGAYQIQLWEEANNNATVICSCSLISKTPVSFVLDRKGVRDK